MQAKSRLFRRATSNNAPAPRDQCQNFDDYIVIDGDSYGITGYVHFGDSYATGMGTGTTSGDTYRVGSNNFGNLLHKSFGNDNIPYQRKACSGDTTKGLNRQIDEWKDPARASIGTVSIGGNNIGFTDLVWYCILTPNTGHSSDATRARCLEAEKKARDMIRDDGENGIKAKLIAAYLRILQKSGRSVRVPLI